VLFASVGIGAITATSLVLGWALLAVTEAERHRGRGAQVPVAPPRRPAAAQQPARRGNTLQGVGSAAARRRRDPVSGQHPRVERSGTVGPGRP
jgi:hypothetical protein